MNSLMMLYRLSNLFYRKKIYFLSSLIYRFNRVYFSIDLPPSVKIGEGTLFAHNGLGCVVNSEAIIGNNCKIYQNVTIGGRHERGVPVIEDNVFIGAGACVLGGIKIGSNSNIGANSVVIKDVKSNTTVVGVPAYEVK